MIPILVQSIATALPPYKVSQHDVRELVYRLFSGEYQGLQRLMPVFENTQITSRYFSQPLSWFEQQRSFVESSNLFVETAIKLLVNASNSAIQNAGIQREDISMVVAVSTTGIATPSLDAKLIQALCLPRTVKRVPVWGLGCAGGVAGLARAAELLSAMPDGSYGLCTAVELCSLTFQRNDISKSNIIASSLFADGAAALVLKKPQEDKELGMRILASYSYIFDDSEDIMGWDIIETGLKVRFARDIPTLITEHLPGIVAEACAAWGICTEEIRHFVLHAGGAKVLQAYQDSLKLTKQDLCTAYHVLQNYGNMSSVSVLFALQELMRSAPAPHELGMMIALGPGFSAELLLFCT
ncbi:MAG: 3-oxoacyl-[acyl-carrier-protein] synthase III C-terminal domain-containing protein [Bacteroidota bacterium]|nr:stilbene synthase [Candidatus Kapabacteria bacterium]MDW8219003.1 3-oxoacyl-[acyl-carrier-protein] synthase III C-terminal domain-containing protein [Bacteroidota bacterium]